jgi:hypothetical protein
MIDPNWQVVDLDPVTWREIGRFFDPGHYLRTVQAGEHGLFVLHERGNVQRIVDSKTGVRRDLLLEGIDDPQECAQRLYERGEWERVHVVEKGHLALVAQSAQATPQRELTLDQYYHRVYQLLWGNPVGYVSVPAHPGHWHGWTYKYLRDVLQKVSSSPASLALGVFEGDRLLIGLILMCAGGQICKVTTFEVLPAGSFALGLSAVTVTDLREALAETIAPPAGVLLCAQEVFEDWIEREEKMEILLAGREKGLAYWYWAETAGL